MGLREKVALAIVVIIQVVNTLSIKENPFEQYVGQKQCGKNCMNSAISKSDINNLKYSGGNTFICSSRKNSNYGATPASTTSNMKYDPAILEKFKNDARRKRKNKKLQNIALNPTQSQDKKLSLTDIGAFPEVEYPLCAMDTWEPKYWNSLSCHMEDFNTKSNSIGSQPMITLNSDSFQNKLNTKKHKGTHNQLISSKKETKIKTAGINQNTKTTNTQKNSTLLELGNTKTQAKNVSLGTNKPTTLDRLSRRKLRKRVKSKHINSKAQTKSCNPQLLRNNKILLNESSDLSSFLSDTNKEKLDTAPQSKLDFGQYPSDVICKSQTENKGSNTILSSDSNQYLINPLPNSATIKDENYVPTPSEESVKSISQTVIDQPNQVSNSAGPNVLNDINPEQGASHIPSELPNLAEQVLAQIHPVSVEYNVPKEYKISPQKMSYYKIPSEEIPNIMNSFTISQNYYENKEKQEQMSLCTLVNLYNLVEKVLAEINLKQNIPDQALVKIIPEIESLPVDYTVTDTSIPDRTTEVDIFKPSEFVLPNLMNTNEKMSEKLLVLPNEQNGFVQDNLQKNNTTEIAVDVNKNVIVKNNESSVCPITTTEQCFLDDYLGSNTYNMTSLPSTLNLMETLNGSNYNSLIDNNRQLNTSIENAQNFTMNLKGNINNGTIKLLQKEQPGVIPEVLSNRTNVISNNSDVNDKIITPKEILTPLINEPYSTGIEDLSNIVISESKYNFTKSEQDIVPILCDTDILTDTTPVDIISTLPDCESEAYVSKPSELGDARQRDRNIDTMGNISIQNEPNLSNISYFEPTKADYILENHYNNTEKDNYVDDFAATTQAGRNFTLDNIFPLPNSIFPEAVCDKNLSYSQGIEIEDSSESKLDHEPYVKISSKEKLTTEEPHEAHVLNDEIDTVSSTFEDSSDINQSSESSALEYSTELYLPEDMSFNSKIEVLPTSDEPEFTTTLQQPKTNCLKQGQIIDCVDLPEESSSYDIIEKNCSVQKSMLENTNIINVNSVSSDTEASPELITINLPIYVNSDDLSEEALDKSISEEVDFLANQKSMSSKISNSSESIDA